LAFSSSAAALPPQLVSVRKRPSWPFRNRNYLGTRPGSEWHSPVGLRRSFASRERETPWGKSTASMVQPQYSSVKLPDASSGQGWSKGFSRALAGRNPPEPVAPTRARSPFWGSAIGPFRLPER
jgi:hypothetical protein